MNKNFKISKLKQDDIENLVNLENMFFSKAWTNSQFLEAINSKNYLVYGLKLNKVLVSYVVIRMFPEISKLRMSEGSEFEILNIATHESYQNQGLANKLLTYIIKLASKLLVESVFLDVRLSNTPAISLYTRHLFIEVGRRKNYYTTSSGKEDGLIMQRKLS